MSKISQADFKFLKDKLHKDKNYHSKEFLERINPDLIDSYYEGKPDLDDGDNNPSTISLNRIFPATNTLVSQFYPQNPKFICSPRREGDELSSAIASSAMNYYYEQMKALQENQKAIISGWMYGFGVTKQGWRTEFHTPETVKVNPIDKFAQKIKNFSSPRQEEDTTPEYIEKEGPFLNFINSKNIYFDSEQPFGKGLFMHERIPRTLHQIQESNLYGVDDDFKSYFKRFGKDPRDTTIDIFETYCWKDNYLYLLVQAEEYKKPLRYDKLPYAGEGFPYRVLSLTDQVNKVYHYPHMKVAQRLQKLNDYILTLQKEHIERHKNMTIFTGDAFDKDSRDAINLNENAANLFTKGNIPATQAAQHLGNNTIPKDMFALQDIVSTNIKEILGAIGARHSGESEQDTATQEKISEFGNQLRASAMQDKIREFLVNQGRKLLADIKQFGTAPALFKITGLNLEEPQLDPQTGQQIMVPVTEKWVEFATDKSPETLKEVIPAELDLSVDVTNTTRRDITVIRQQLEATIARVTDPTLVQLMALEGKRVKVSGLVEKLLASFETIDNPGSLIEDVPVPPPQPEQQGQPQPGGAPVEVPGEQVPQMPGVV